MARKASRVDAVAAGIRARIGDGAYAVGERLPTESELSETFEVSRPTVRAALSELKTEGLVRTRHGVGTFVSEPPVVTAGLEKLESITESIRRTGREPSMRYRSRTIRPLLPDEAAKLDLTTNDTALETRRVILADDEIVAYSYDLLPIGVFPEGESPDVLDGSVFAYLRDARGIVPTRAVAEIHPVVSEHVTWDTAPGRSGLALLLDQVHYDQDDRVVAYSRTYFIDDRYTFSIIRHA
ncbi:GntR family transcriptional regulator [Microbacterium sp. JB110]|uniref:GntR family transcriptional regulator n=1 Tax=Microbacterium sp. JB110 TaxID=2024477 RepID=UPI00097F5678|nr:GntR family transcriptional regulator [Microbacterium sp. JB110]SJM58289.1 Transcriptional regulator, GntR family [Frigoribacterium sp. JB110]